MVDRSRWTKKDYAEALDLALVERDDFKDKIAALAEKLDEPISDHEGRAILACANALDVLDRVERNARNSGGNYSTTYSTSFPSYGAPVTQPGPLGKVQRVIEYLRLRYGLPDPSAELRQFVAVNAEVAAERDRLRRRLAEIEGAVTGQPPQGGF